MKTLAIESSCDDTSLAVVEYDDGYFSEWGMVTHRQTALHDSYGGVVPELAYRAHAEHILPVLQELGGASLADEIDCITVTARPGLPGALLVGITMAHTLGKLWDKPVIEVNHIMGHVFSILLGRQLATDALPYICLTVSGGHTDIYGVSHAWQPLSPPASEDDWIKRQHLGIGEQLEIGPFAITKLWQSRDDAAWEVFDKVARMLGGPYPGGVWISQLAEQGGPDERIQFRPPRLEEGSLDMSFSGLKSQVYQLLQRFERDGIELDDGLQANIVRAFQEAITTLLAEQVTLAAQQYDARVVGLVGGVAANTRLQEQVRQHLANISDNPISIVQPTQLQYCTDNAAMIGVVGLLEQVE